MDARPLDVLEEARDQHPFAVRDGVDVDLDALEIAVDADRAIGIDDGGRRELAGEVRRRVAEIDGQAADHEGRPDDDRVADPLGERQRLLHRVRHPAFRLRDAEPVEERREAGPFLGLVDRLEVAAEQRDAAGGQRRGEVERRLAAVRDDRREEVAAIGALGVDDVAHALGVERLEIEPGRGVEVGRDRLGVGVDHDRAPAGAAERAGRLDRAVVELDPLPDADRPRADDESRGAGDRRRLGGGSGGRVGRVEVRRLGGELRGARVDHRVARVGGRGPGGPPGSRPGSCRQDRPARGRRTRPA